MNECFVLFPGSSTSRRVKIDFFQWEFIALKWGPAPKMGLRQRVTTRLRVHDLSNLQKGSGPRFFSKV